MARWIDSQSDRPIGKKVGRQIGGQLGSQIERSKTAGQIDNANINNYVDKLDEGKQLDRKRQLGTVDRQEDSQVDMGRHKRRVDSGQGKG